MGHAAIDDDRLVHALIDGIGHAADLGDHAARNDAGGLIALDLGHLHLGDEGALVVLIPQQARDIGHGYQLLRFQRNRDLRSGGVGVHVVGLTQIVHAHRGDHGDEAAVQQACDQGGVHMHDLAHMAQLGVQLGAAQHLAVHAAQAHAAAAQLGNQIFVHLTGQHLLHDLHGGIVSHAQTVCEMALHAHFLQHLVDGRAAAVHQHHAHTQQGKGDQIVHDGIFQFFVDHGIAAVLYHHGLSVILLDVGCRLREKARHFFVFHKISSEPSQSMPCGIARFPFLSLTRHLPPARGKSVLSRGSLCWTGHFIS